MKWWAYVHTNGALQLKRYLGYLDLKEADESPFVVRRTEPFDAETREEAEQKAREILGLND
jgi:hypothetical protein